MEYNMLLSISTQLLSPFQIYCVCVCIGKIFPYFADSRDFICLYVVCITLKLELEYLVNLFQHRAWMMKVGLENQLWFTIKSKAQITNFKHQTFFVDFVIISTHLPGTNTLPELNELIKSQFPRSIHVHKCNHTAAEFLTESIKLELWIHGMGSIRRDIITTKWNWSSIKRAEAVTSFLHHQQYFDLAQGLELHI